MLTVKTGLTAPEGFLKDAFAIDKAVYEEKYWGKFENLQKRYEACKDSFILIYDNDKLIGYTNFFPVNDELKEKMTSLDNNEMYDDNIKPEEIHDWSKEDDNHVFIISIAILPAYRKSDAIILLGNQFLKFLINKNNEGFEISSLSGYAVSDGGVKYLQRFRASKIKDTADGDHFLHACQKDIDRLLKFGMVYNKYEKTYRNDIYFFIPMTTTNEIDTFSELCSKNIRKRTDEMDISTSELKEPETLKFGDIYCYYLNDHIKYECKRDHFIHPHIKRFYLGEFELACYDDDYDGLSFYEETAHLLVTAHPETGIYIITIAIRDNIFSPSQLIDQMSTEHLEIRKVGEDKFININDYFQNFGLEICGETKCVVCLENNIDKKMELPYLLSGETMISKHIDYLIRPERRDALIQNHAVYDYYDSYISRSVIAFLFKDYSEDIIKRIKNEASELFIVEIVLFQNTAVHRTNQKVVKKLEKSEAISNKDINDLYIEFGKTAIFWDDDIFKYPLSQKEADEAIKTFGIAETLDIYHRNQKFLDRLIQNKSNIEEQQSSDKMNGILFFLTCFQTGSVILPVVLWIFYFLTSGSINFNGEPIVRIITVIIIVLLAIYLYFAAKINLNIKLLKHKPKPKKNKKEKLSK